MNGPNDNPHLTLQMALEREIHHVCGEFVKAWKTSLSPRIEDYVDRVAVDGRPKLLLELIVEEVDLRRQAGDSPDRGEYQRRFPQ